MAATTLLPPPRPSLRRMAGPEPLTLAQFLDLPERKPALEFEEGRAIRKVSPKAKHSTLQSELCERINQFNVPARVARAYPELRTTFGGRSYVPDVAVYRWARIPRDPDGRVADDMFTPPDIAIEIVSPRQSVTRLIARCIWYVTNGVPVALLVDPNEESVLCFRVSGPAQALQPGDTLDLSDVVPGLSLDVAALFASLRV